MAGMARPVEHSADGWANATVRDLHAYLGELLEFSPESANKLLAIEMQDDSRHVIGEVVTDFKRAGSGPSRFALRVGLKI